MTLRRWVYRLLFCSWTGHFGIRVPKDPTMKQTTDAITRCIDCWKHMPDDHLKDLDKWVSQG
jgi:hypothetical protein